MKTILTSIFTILAFSVFAQVKVNGVEIPDSINIIEAGLMQYKSLDKYVIIIDYGQVDGWPLLPYYIATDEKGVIKKFNGWVQAVNYLNQNGFELLDYVEHETRLPGIDAAVYVTFIMRKKS